MRRYSGVSGRHAQNESRPIKLPTPFIPRTRARDCGKGPPSAAVVSSCLRLPTKKLGLSVVTPRAPSWPLLEAGGVAGATVELPTQTTSATLDVPLLPRLAVRAAPRAATDARSLRVSHAPWASAYPLPRLRPPARLVPAAAHLRGSPRHGTLVPHGDGEGPALTGVPPVVPPARGERP